MLPSFLKKPNLLFNKYAILLVISIIYLLVIFYLPIQFEMNDDVVMMLLSSGGYTGTPSVNLVFINYFYALFLCGLYNLTEAINWYPILFVIFHLVAVIIIAQRILSREYQGKVFSFIFLILIIGIDLLLILRLQFTTTSAILMTSAVVLLLNNSHKSLIIGSFLFITATLVRFEAAILALAVISPLFLAKLSHSRMNKSLVYFVVSGFLSLVLFGIGSYQYNSVDKNYYEYNKVRGQINDHPNADLSPSELPNTINENDYFLLKYFFQDGAVMNLSIINKIKEKVTKNNKSITVFNPITLIKYSHIELILALVLLLGIAIFFSTHRKNKLIITISIVILFLCFSYVINTATLKYRVLASGIFPFITLLSSQKIVLKNNYHKIAIAFTLLILIAYCSRLFLFWKEDNIMRNKIFIEQVSLLKNRTTYVIPFGGNFSIAGNNLFNNTVKFDYKKIRFAGWLINHPDNEKFSSHRDLLRQDYEILIQKKSIDKIIPRIKQSIQDNYNKQTTIIITKESNNFALIKFSESNN